LLRLDPLRMLLRVLAFGTYTIDAQRCAAGVCRQ
jgi:hypothetical protein